MRTCSRRSVLAALGAALPFGLGGRARTADVRAETSLAFRFRSFEDAVRDAFASPLPADGAAEPTCRRIEVGDSELVRAGVQGCHNDRPFAGFPAGHLRIVRTASAAGPARCGVRLYVTTVDVVRVGPAPPAVPSRPLDFAALPPAPRLV